MPNSTLEHDEDPEPTRRGERTVPNATPQHDENPEPTLKTVTPTQGQRFFSTEAALYGSIAGMMTDTLFYGVDSYKVHAQARAELDGRILSFSRLFRGLVPSICLGALPTYAMFFMFYQPIKSKVDKIQGPGGSQAVSVVAASLVASVPSSLVYVPADVIKKRLVLSFNEPTAGIIKSIYQTSGFSGFLLGWRANLIKDVTFGALKMSIYEAVARTYLRFFAGSHRIDGGADSLTSKEAAVVGFGSGCATSVLTMPLDNVNTRIKSGELGQVSVARAHVLVAQKDGVGALFRGVVPRTLMIGFGSTFFWYSHAKVTEILGKRDFPEL